MIRGVNLGDRPIIFVNNRSCDFISNSYDTTDGRLQTVLCKLPAAVVNTSSPLASNYTTQVVGVRVQNSLLPGLINEVFSLQYAVAPPVPDQPIVTNIGANKVDLVWSPPGTVKDHMTVTGYKIMWFQPKYRSMPSNCTVGNVTVTSIRGLQPGTEYVFAIAAVTEGLDSANLPTDLYGRRDLLPPNQAKIGEFSIFTNITATLPFDFDFNFFSANQTHNASSATKTSHLGPTGSHSVPILYILCE